jgi:hypothetical protein
MKATAMPSDLNEVRIRFSSLQGCLPRLREKVDRRHRADAINIASFRRDFCWLCHKDVASLRDPVLA